MVRLEPSGISIARVEHALNYTNRKWWIKVANLTEQVIYLDRNDVIAYVSEAKVEPLDTRVVNDILKLVKRRQVGRGNM